MEGHCSAGVGPQWAVVPMVEEEGGGGGGGRRRGRRRGKSCVKILQIYFNSFLHDRKDTEHTHTHTHTHEGVLYACGTTNLTVESTITLSFFSFKN